MGQVKLVVTPGDPSGIGAEVVWKSIRKNHSRWRKTPLLCVGARAPFERLKARIISADPADLTPPREKRPHIWLLEAPVHADPKLLLEGYQSGWSIETAAELVLSGECAALVTGPIHKERLNRGGYAFSGHTDFLATLCRGADEKPSLDVTMMLANDTPRVSLVTTHCSLASVPKKLTEAAVTRAVEQTISSLKTWWKIKRPKISVCALNPHAGESGLFGTEEADVLRPAIEKLRARFGREVTLSDPLPADTLFANHIAASAKDRADAVICMYHDQGLIPVKLIDFPNTVNVTLGLPIIRTSVDHGTGFDIAGKDRADHRSFAAATNLALQFIQKRKTK
jgi:4-hydroxythreonine-4-phosphate dehydrogenase